MDHPVLFFKISRNNSQNYPKLFMKIFIKMSKNIIFLEYLIISVLNRNN